MARVLWRRRLLVLTCVVVVLGLTSAYVKTLTPMFEAATLVAAGDRPEGLEPRPGTSGDRAAGDARERAADLHLIRSRTMAARLIDRLDLRLSPEFNPRLRSERSWWVGSMAPLAAAVVEAVAARSGKPTDEERAARLHEQIVGSVLARIRAEPVDVSTLSLRFISADPALASAGATALAELYLESRREAQQQNWHGERQRLQLEVERLAATISATEKAIEELRANAVGGDRPSEQDLLDMTAELAFWRGERVELEARLRQAGGTRAFEAALAHAGGPGPARLGKPEGREVALEQELAPLLQAAGVEDGQTSDGGADLVALDRQERSLVEQSVRQLEQEIALIRSRETALEASIETLQGQLAESGAADGPEALERQAEADRALMRSYVDRLRQRAPAPQAGEPGARIIAPAIVPREPKYPRLALIYGTALGGALLLGGLLALGLEVRDRAAS